MGVKRHEGEFRRFWRDEKEIFEEVNAKHRCAHRKSYL